MNKITIILLLFSICFVKAQNIETKKVFTKDSVFISLENTFFAPVELKLSKQDSVNGEFRYKEEVLLDARELLKDVLVLPLSLVKDTSAIDINKYVKLRGTLGDSKKAKHNENYLYTLPYPKRKSYRIMQSFGGKFSHYKKHSKYAIDFTMKVGDTITAAREGIVISVKEDSKEQGRTEKYADKGNRVRIYHTDGTFASYVHLDYNGALVNVGDRVEAGQPIGISGFTGFTTKPHLHLVIYAPKGVSVPFYFKGIGKKKLKRGKYYKRKR